MTLGEYVNNYINEHDMSIRKFASLAGVSHSYISNIINGKTARGKMTDNYFTVMPAIKFTWLNKSHFGLYSKAALGATLRSEKNDDIHYSESEVHINWHATLIGVEFGGTQFRGFCDFGFGEQGVLSAGLRYKF
jgi:transcriptional regulator with XRE-family HTH domain